MVRFSKNIITKRNVEYLGYVDPANFSDYFEDVGAGIIPYKVNEWTSGVFPTKLFEYASYGLNIYSTPISEVVKFSCHAPLHIIEHPCKLSWSSVPKAAFEILLNSQTWSDRVSVISEDLITK